MRRQTMRLTVFLLAGAFVYKATTAAFAAKIPGQPFYGFGLREWLMWVIDPRELAFIVIGLIVEYGIIYFVARRLTTARLVACGGVLGLYAAVLLFPLDLLA